MKAQHLIMFQLALLTACSGSTDPVVEGPADPIDQCVFCDSKADAFGIARESYLAEGIVKLANTASLEVLDDDVPLDVRAARGIVAGRPFEYIEEIDTVSYVGERAFTNLARYAEENGFVPYCGDAELQPILEGCDDGNAIDGDGCSSTCQVEAGPGQTNFLADIPDLIKGSDIGGPAVDPNTYYLRERSIAGLNLDDEDVAAILERADSINANSAGDDIVSYDELEILSKEPFYSSLFSDEKAALAKAWEIFSVSDTAPAVVEYTGGDISSDSPFTTTIDRVGPVVVDGTRRIADLDADTAEVAQRLQQMPGANADGNNSTIQLADIEKALADYTPVLTQYEIYDLEALKQAMFDEATPEDGGDFVITFPEMPNQGTVNTVLADFDGITFRIHVRNEIHFDAYDPDWSLYSTYPYDANLRSEFAVHTSMSISGAENIVNTGCGVWYTCAPFRHSQARFLNFDGTSARAGTKRGMILLERWKNGERIYNRVVDFKNTFREIDEIRSYHNQFALARPMLADGTFLSPRKSTTINYGQKEYTRFKLSTVTTAFNRNISKFFPNHGDEFDVLPTGRYEEVEGVVMEVHASKAVFAYLDGCEVPLAVQDGYLEGKCESSGRKVVVQLDGHRAYLRVYSYSGSRQAEVQLVNTINPHLAIDLDRTYYTIK